MKLDIMRFLLLYASLGVAQTYSSVQNNYSLVHLRRAANMECTLDLLKTSRKFSTGFLRFEKVFLMSMHI